MGITILICIIVVAGILGGTANFYMEQAAGVSYRKSIFLGLTAAATVPLFLKTVSSSLMDDSLKGDVVSYFVFFGFCTVAAIFSSKFLQSLADKLLQDLQEIKQKQQDLSETTDVLVAQNSDPSEEEPSASAPPAGNQGAALESFKIGGAGSKSAAPAPLSDEQKVLTALKSSKYAFRTAEGLAKDAELDVATVQAKLNEMEALGKVKKTKRHRDDAVLWCLR